MDKEAVNAMIKGIKEGAHAMTPLAKEYVHQVQMLGMVDVTLGVLLLATIAIGALVIVRWYNKRQKGDYLIYEDIQGILALWAFGIVSAIVLLLAVVLIGSGLENIVAPLPSILGK